VKAREKACQSTTRNHRRWQEWPQDLAFSWLWGWLYSQAADIGSTADEVEASPSPWRGSDWDFFILDMNVGNSFGF